MLLTTDWKHCKTVKHPSQHPLHTNAIHIKSLNTRSSDKDNETYNEYMCNKHKIHSNLSKSYTAVHKAKLTTHETKQTRNQHNTNTHKCAFETSIILIKHERELCNRCGEKSPCINLQRVSGRSN